jgi:C-terminal processing protease CtpA/Prc
MPMKAVVFIVLVCCSLVSCVSSRQPNYVFNQKYAADDLKSDVVLLKKILEANHPSLYWYTPKDSMDYYFNNALASINDSLTELQFRNKVASVISKIRCGHTSVRFSKAFSKLSERNRYPQFPLFFKVWDDSLVVLASMFPRDSIFKRGTIVTSINGKTNRQLLDGMFDIISTDGYSDNYKNQVISNNFPSWYRSTYGLDSSYTIKFIDSSGKEATTIIKNFTPPKRDTTARRRDTTIRRPALPSPPPQPTRKERKQATLLSKRSMQIDSNINTAYMRITSFSGGKLRKFFRRSFKEIKEKNVANIVIDLRENGGGNVALSTKLAKYLADKPFKNADTVAAISRTFPYRSHIKDWWMYWFPMNFAAKKKADGRIHFGYFERHYFKPKTNNHFDGNVYIIQGGVTFSASTMFISSMKGQKNVTVAGEETGGGYYGNTAMHLPNIELPISHIRVGLPMYRLVMDSTRTKNGRGIMPDVWIKPSSVAIKKGIDIKLQTIRKMIIDKKKV